jgi:hypothetical protein
MEALNIGEANLSSVSFFSSRLLVCLVSMFRELEGGRVNISLLCSISKHVGEGKEALLLAALHDRK